MFAPVVVGIGLRVHVRLPSLVLPALSTGDGAPLPGCTSIEVMQIRILDPNGNVFAVPGVFKDLPN